MKKITLLFCLVLHILLLKAQTLPVPDHVIVLMLENKGYTKIIGSSNAPYLNSLISDPNCALFSECYGVTHPSQPNYIALFSGNTQGVTNDQTPTGTPFSTCNLGSSLLTHGYTFTGYSEDLPSVGSLVSTSGNYAQKHCPWSFWQGIGTNQIPGTTHVPYSSFPASTSYSTLPTVSFIIPNLVHDMHDPIFSAATAVANGDAWLSNNIPSLVQWVKTHNSLLIIHYDEDEGIVVGGVTIGGQGNNIPTCFIGSMVQGGTYNNHMNHYSILRTIEDMYGLPKCDSSAFYGPITNCWATSTGVNDLEKGKQPLLYPSPASNQLNISAYSEYSDDVTISITDVAGRLLKNEKTKLTIGTNNLKIDTKELKSGTYFLSLQGSYINTSQKFIVRKE